MTIHFQKNKAAPRFLILVLFCCLFCVSLPAASAASSDEGLIEGRFSVGFTFENSNIQKIIYGGSDHYYYKTVQSGDFSDGSSFLPSISSGAFVSTGDGFVDVSYPDFYITLSQPDEPTPTSLPTHLSFRVRSVENGITTETDYPVTGFSDHVSSDSSTYVMRTYPGSFRFPVTEGGRYDIYFRPLFRYDANTKVGSFLVVQSSSPVTFATSSNDVKLRPYASGSRSVVGLDVAHYPVTVIAPDGCTVNPLEGYSFPVEEKASCRFTVDIAKGYRKTDSFSVKVNGETITPTDSGLLSGSYLISKPTGEQTIEVTGVEALSFDVMLPDIEGCKLSPCEGYSSPVKAGGDFLFRVEIEEGYTWSGQGVYVNGKLINCDVATKICAIRNITEDQIITVNGVKKRPQYNIFLSEGEGYYISPRFDNPVYGDMAHRFKVIILDGYRKSDSFVVRRNGEVIDAAFSGVYTLLGLKTDTTITVEGVEKIPASYSVTFSNSGGCTVVPVAGSSFTVEEGGTFRFMVQIESGYRKTADFAVSANGVKLTAVNGEYCIGNITSPQKISVSGVIAIPGVTPGHKPDYSFDTDTTNFIYDTISLFDRVVDTALSFPVLLFFGSVAAVLICFAIFQRLYSRGKRGRNH